MTLIDSPVLDVLAIAAVVIGFAGLVATIVAMVLDIAAAMAKADANRQPVIYAAALAALFALGTCLLLL